MHARDRLIALAVLLTLAACSARQSGTPSRTSTSRRDWGAYIDFTELREEYGARDDFSQVCEENRPQDQIAEAINTRNWPVADRLSKAWLESCPVDAQIHFWRAAVLLEFGDREGSAHHKRWFIGLTDSARATGDGRTPGTAFVTISVAEEYAVLITLGLTPKRQSILKSPLVDAIEAETPSGELVTVYFNPAAHFKRLDKMLDGRPPAFKD